MDPLRIRRMSSIGRARLAAHAGVSEEVLRVYELDRRAVSESSRARLDPVYAELARRLVGELEALRAPAALSLVGAPFAGRSGPR